MRYKLRVFFLTLLILLSFIQLSFAGSQQTSSTLASAIIVNARYYLNESSASFWSDAELLVYLNDGTLDIVARTHCLEAIETETLVADTLAYALADSFIVIKAVIYDGSRALTKGSIDGIGDLDPSLGEPSRWTQWESNVIVYPAPDASAAGNDIDVYTVKRPASVASGAAVLIPAYYDKALTLYIVAQALKRDKRYAESNAVLSEYLAELNRYRVDFSEQPARNK